ncbi:hypothetical protein [Enterobacter ludwigii]|uniref:hypothetical protein n=1 Tax=Enterobacter ludwigii TaxID=299767 RepID=UPI000A4B9FFD|nr:hypothetical protein [Enterobacter ludwigii]MED5734034.1 hypothetical protein [Enterobacter ludwigii]HDR2456645.1 hypothetical protein [Enterobacter ludwigii]HDR2552331.1 hypothetical protein [Enterobacter ludwigii]HDR2556898.1 hypothetical protein [Enterobacter ludwigii]HDR2570723.1 hypothetical protein [Enterobacter ludwigii]
MNRQGDFHITILSTLSESSRVNFIEQLIAGDAAPSCMPDTATPVSYAQALAQAILGNTLPQSVNKALIGLLHDMVYLLADFVKEPYLHA